MNKKEAEKKTIIIYWWNFGKKQLDFEGTYKEYMMEKHIKVRSIKHPHDKETNGYRFNIPCGSAVIKLDDFGCDYINCCTLAIRLFLTYLGDKTKFIDGFNREYLINWR